MRNSKEDIQLYSFDLFDTLVTRTTLFPSGIFSLMEKKLISDSEYADISSNFRNNFFILRRNALDYLFTVYTSFSQREVLLKEIYDLFVRSGYLSETQAERVYNLEIQTELINLLPIKYNIEKVNKLINEGKKVVIITDTYFSIDIIKRIVSSIGISTSVKIYSSSFWGKTKRHGDIWAIVRTQENVEYENWLHFGDDLYADFNIPNSLGIKCEHFKTYTLEEWEKTACINDRSSFYQLAVGASKNIFILQDESKLSSKFFFGVSYVAPLVFPYVSFIIETAYREGIQSLYFIARDGFLLQKMADIIIQSKGYNIKTKYIYGSRKAWRVCAFAEKKNDISFIFNEFWLDNTIKNICDRLNLTEEEIKPFIPKEIKKININQKLSESDLQKLYKTLNSSEDFRTFLLEKNKENIELVRKYFEQEINFKEKFAFVDSQGTGKTQTLVSDFLSKLYNTRIKSYFYELSQRYTGESDIKRIYSFKSTPSFFIEVFLRDTNGQCIGYKENDSTIEPVFDDEDVLLKKWGYHDVVAGTMEYTKQFVNSCMTNKTEMNYSAISVDYYNYAHVNPNKKFCDIVGSIPFAKEGTRKELAPELTLKNLFFYSKLHKTLTEYLPLSIGRSNGLFRRIFLNSLKVRNILRIINDAFHKRSSSILLLKIINYINRKHPTSLTFLNSDFPYYRKLCIKNKTFRIVQIKKNIKKSKLLGITYKKVPLKNHFIKIIKQLENNKIIFDDIYLIQIVSMGEAYLFATIFKTVLVKNKSKQPVLVFTKAIYKQIFELLYSDIPMYVCDSTYISDFIGLSVDDVLIFKSHKIYVPFTMEYLKGVEKKILLGDKVHYFDELCKSQGVNTEEILSSTSIASIHIDDIDIEAVKTKCAKINLNFNRFVIFSPETVTCAYYSKNFWCSLRDIFLEKDIDIFLNITDEKNYIEGTKYCPMSIKEIISLSTMAKRIIGVRSGLLEILASQHIPMDILYTCFPLQNIQTDFAIQAFSVKKLPFVIKETIQEYNTQNFEEKELLRNIKIESKDLLK